VADAGAVTVLWTVMAKSVRDVIGDPESWSDFQLGGTRMPLLRGATIVGAREVEPDELRLSIDARGQVLRSTFVIADRDVRQRLLEILKPGLLLDDGLNQSL
jgi:hypothetical protein